MSRGRARSRQRRDARYHAAVRRQIALVAAWQAAKDNLRRSLWMPAPVEDFLRRGDTVETFVDAEVDHSGCDFAWKPVRCDRCGTGYVCTPSSDYYCTPEGDHCCEPCLLGGMQVVTVRLIGGAR